MITDIFVATSKAKAAIVSPLRMVTYVTANEAETHKMLTEGLNLEASDWFYPSDIQKPDMDVYLGFDDGDIWKARRYFRSDEGENIQIRLIVVSDDKPQVRPEVDGTYLGGLSIGFPLVNSDAREAHMRSLGFPSIVGVKRLEFSSPEGEKYVSEEVHFVGPDNVYILAVRRPDIFVPVGPLNKAAKIGAPAYSAICSADCDAAIAFYKDVLGYEIRRDMTMEVGDKSGLKLRKGSTERFVQAFAPGSSTGYLVILNHGEDAKTAPGITNYGIPNRGLAMWSFGTHDIHGVLRRAKEAGVKIRQPLGLAYSPFLHESDKLILEDPNGFPIEVYSL